MKKTLRLLKNILIVYLLYFVVGGLIIFKLPINGKNKVAKYDLAKITEDINIESYAQVIDSTKDALDLRLRILEEAQESIEISSFKLEDGIASNLIFGGILKQIETKNIKARVLVDGLIYEKTETFKAVFSHPNITEYIFEPLNLLLPFTVNNIMHDKLYIIDSNYGITGGRNITERFLIEGHPKETHDRDVILYSKNNELPAIKEMTSYFNEVLESKYVQKLQYKDKIKYQQIRSNLITNYDEYMKDVLPLDELLDKSAKVDNATYVRGPLNRFNKEAIVFNTLEGLMDLEIQKDNPKIVMQSPYITKSRTLRKYYNGDFKHKITFITNNMTTNANFAATTGYSPIRKKLAKYNNLYEHQGTNSLHAKSGTIGTDLSFIGSLNLDNRSMHLSTESTLVIYSKEFNQLLSNSFDEIINESLQVDSKGNYVTNDNVDMVKQDNFKMFMIKIGSVFTNLLYEML